MATKAEEKLRLMCSYGGRILPRAHNKTLCYAGGETRLVKLHRTAAATYTSLTTHLATHLHHPRPFLLKYLLPGYDLDSLVTVSSDEDLDNLLDEYDALLASRTPSRIRFFLFPLAGEDNPKVGDWLADAMMEERDRGSSFGSTGSSNSGAVKSGADGDINSVGGGGGGVLVQDVKVPLPSVDSLGSDYSIPSPNFSHQAIVYQDASELSDSKAVCLLETESNVSDRSPRNDMLTPVQVSSYILSKPMEQPLLPVRPPTPPPYPAQPHYVPQYYPNSVQATSYPAMYQPYFGAQQPVRYQNNQMNKPYPVYMMPVGQAQSPYDMSMPCSLATTQNVAPCQTQVPSNLKVVASPVVYEGYRPTVSTTQAPEYAAEAYRPPAVVAQPMTVSSDDHHHHQAVAVLPVNPPSQPVPVSPFESTSYISEYEDPLHTQIYKSQPSGPALPSELQTTTST